MPVVSVLMPCFNAEDTLDEAMESLACQTMPDFEVIAVDDGSGDATPEILREWAKRDRRVQVISQPHQGIVVALNKGLRACKTNYIARMDSDDRSHPDRLKKQVAHLKDHPSAALVGCQVRAYPHEGVRRGFLIYITWQNSLLSDEDIRREMFIESPITHPSVIFRREWVERVGGYQDHGWAEDYDLWLRLYLEGAQFAKLGEVLLDWREGPDRLTRRDNRYSLENFLRAKAHYLVRGPLTGRDAVILWGAGMIGRRLSKHLARQGSSLVAFLDIDPKKIGGSLRGLPILSPDELPSQWGRYGNPVVLAAVGARGARQRIRVRLNQFGLTEGKDWWGVA
jgi:glycosyltransferase involved in cell wall biosynthesis